MLHICNTDKAEEKITLKFSLNIFYNADNLYMTSHSEYSKMQWTAVIVMSLQGSTFTQMTVSWHRH